MILPLVSQNIENNVATSIDYILKAQCLLSLYNTEQTNNEVKSLISKANSISPNNINLKKTEILIALRIKDKENAILHLKEYYNDLVERLENIKQYIGAKHYDYDYNYLIDELSWADNMIVKVQGL